MALIRNSNYDVNKILNINWDQVASMHDVLGIISASKLILLCLFAIMVSARLFRIRFYTFVEFPIAQIQAVVY